MKQVEDDPGAQTGPTETSPAQCEDTVVAHVTIDPFPAVGVNGPLALHGPEIRPVGV